MFQWIEALTLDRSTGSAVARVHVSAEEELFRDHFPGQALLPGSIAIELAAQVAGPLAEAVTEAERYAFLSMVRNAKFVKPIGLPAKASIEALVTRKQTDHVTVQCTVLRAAERVASAELTMALVAPEAEWRSALESRREHVERWKRAWCATS